MTSEPARRPIGSWASSDAARATMRANRGRDTTPEMAVRSRVHRAGLRYRVSARPEPDLRRTADLLFRRARVAVFIDGCYWHACPEHRQRPATNTEFWDRKFEANRARDAETTAFLRHRGWTVIRVWEHQVRDDPDLVSAQIIATVSGLLPQHQIEDA